MYASYCATSLAPAAPRRMQFPRVSLLPARLGTPSLRPGVSHPGMGQSAPRCKLPPTFGVPSGNREARMSRGAHSTNHSSCQVDKRCLMMSFLSLPRQKVPRSPFPFSVIYQEVTSLGFVRAFLLPAFRTRYVRTHSKRAVHHASAAAIYPNSIDEFH